MVKNPRKPVIGVMGAGQCHLEISDLAFHVGQLIAAAGAVLVCGGGSGVMEAAARGARDRGGLTIGIMPGMNAHQSQPNESIDVAIFTGMNDGRNWINACACDALIAIAGGYGTLSEVALGLKLGKPVVLLRSWNFESESDLPEPLRAETAEEAVRLALAALPRDRTVQSS